MKWNLIQLWEQAQEFWAGLGVTLQAGAGIALFAIFFFTATRMPNFGPEEPDPDIHKISMAD